MSKRIAVVSAIAGAFLFALASTADAHVSISPASAPQGSTTKLSFLVPNEEAQGDRHEGPGRIPRSSGHAHPRRRGRSEAGLAGDGQDDAPGQTDHHRRRHDQRHRERDRLGRDHARVGGEAGRVRRVHRRRRRPSRRREPGGVQGGADVLRRHRRPLDRTGHGGRRRARTPHTDSRAHRARCRRSARDGDDDSGFDRRRHRDHRDDHERQQRPRHSASLGSPSARSHWCSQPAR